jgi:hypothetical protein
MARFLQRYVQYRRVGFGRIAALRFAWLVSAGSHPVRVVRPATVRLPVR